MESRPHIHLLPGSAGPAPMRTAVSEQVQGNLNLKLLLYRNPGSWQLDAQCGLVWALDSTDHCRSPLCTQRGGVWLCR